MQQTYFMIKPEIVAAKEQKIGDILAIVNRAGFRITRLAMRTMPRELVEYIAGGPVVTVRLEREGAVAALRELIGATNPQDAAIGTIRDLFGASLQNNAVHASANPEDAARELALIFG